MDEIAGEVDKFSWKPFRRQLLAASGVWCTYFLMGMVYGAPTVFIPQLRKTNTTDIDDELASWLSSAFTYACFPWIFIFPALASIIGRRKTSIFNSIVTIISFIVFYFSSTPRYIIIAEVFFGVTQASIFTIGVTVVSEYTSPRYRGLFLTCKGATLYWGIWVSNSIGTFTHWTYIPIVGFVLSLYTLTTFFLPESPIWLASKRRLVECRTVHRSLKGMGKDAELELDQLIESQTTNDKVSLRNLKYVKQKEFYKPLLLGMLSVTQYHLSGKFVITMYSIDLLKKIIANETTVYRSMLLLDGITVFSTYVGCFLTKICKRRTILLTASSIAFTFLLIASLQLYLVKLELITDNFYVTLFLLSGFSWSVSCGPLIMATTLYGELVLSKFKSISFVIICLMYALVHSTLIKMGPTIFKVFSVHGVFFFFGVCSAICVTLMYLYLPETKDKTLLEIEEYFKAAGVIDERRELVKSRRKEVPP